MRRFLLLIPIAVVLFGYKVGPDYARPVVPPPLAFHTPEPIATPEAKSIANLQWFEVFKNEQLQALIRRTLEQNYDLREAVARVDQAQAVLGITRSNQFPNFAAGGAAAFNRFLRNEATLLPSTLVSQTRNYGLATLNLLSFEVDIWGKLRRATEATRANLLSAHENRKAVVTTLIGDVAIGYPNPHSV